MIVEFLIIFFGRTLFNQKSNICLIILHAIGIICTLAYMRLEAHYNRLLIITLLFGFVPFTIEVCSFVYSSLNFRRIVKN
mmetsp:Transcript_39645/g.28644  ORF Transcript_39645/g.28644 Transcript_39645/m.28644 type:complete len:80 (+) Transcript_39645:201-440(+)